MVEGGAEDDALDLDTLASASIVKIPGEPAIVIRGVPSPKDSLSGRNLYDSEDAATPKDKIVARIPIDEVFFLKSSLSEPKQDHSEDVTTPKEEGLTLKGRKVKKKFGKRAYVGEIIEFDPSTNWYKIVYEDGDTEEVDPEELQTMILTKDYKRAFKKRSSGTVNGKIQKAANNEDKGA